MKYQFEFQCRLISRSDVMMELKLVLISVKASICFANVKQSGRSQNEDREKQP